MKHHKYTPLLLYAYPSLAHHFAHIPLGSFPTPVISMPLLSSRYTNVTLYYKHDGLCGRRNEYGNVLFGGNKVRKLEFLLAHAQAHDKTTVVTFGCAGSNHVVATAAYAQHLGITCIGMLKPQANSIFVRRNLALMSHYNAKLYYYPSSGLRALGTSELFSMHKRIFKKTPYLITTGGSQPLGVLGFVNAAFELKEQIMRGELPEPQYIYVATGSLGTVTGLLLGCKAAKLASKIVAVMIEPSDQHACRQAIKSLFMETNRLLHHYTPAFPLFTLTSQELIVRTESAGYDYGLITPDALHALQQASLWEQINLDPTYTAKALDALLKDAACGFLHGSTALFWHTYDGTNFDHLTHNFDFHALHPSLHHYFINSTISDH
ncbi:pyridoxal-phosphate dependent enzyme [Candidatus Dependentiae bacterium]|nr:pyridoxal-phosphate dependent enzyme [Candidatus Dependentiae bacterium]